MSDRLIRWGYGDERGYMRVSEAIKTIREFNAAAIKVRKAQNADHVVYATKEYDKCGVWQEVRFYMLPLSDKDFNERTKHYDGIVCAVHAME